MRFLADALVVFHFAFVVFAVAGGVLVIRWPALAWLHLPAAAWATTIEFSGEICPLTPLENRLREAAGLAGYEGSFVEQYVLPVLYPAGLTRPTQFVLGAIVLGVNAMAYAVVLARRRRRP